MPRNTLLQSFSLRVFISVCAPPSSLHPPVGPSWDRLVSETSPPTVSRHPTALPADLYISLFISSHLMTFSLYFTFCCSYILAQQHIFLHRQPEPAGSTLLKLILRLRSLCSKHRLSMVTTRSHTLKHGGFHCLHLFSFASLADHLQHAHHQNVQSASRGTQLNTFYLLKNQFLFCHVFPTSSARNDRKTRLNFAQQLRYQF